MLKDKRALIGKIFLILGIALGLAIAFLAITAWQVYSFVNLIKTEQSNIKLDIEGLEKGNCTKTADIEQSIKNVEDSAKSMCKNPLIRIATEKMNQLPIKCSTISQVKELITEGLSGIKSACSNKTLANITIEKTCNNKDEICGGIAGYSCCSNLICKYDGDYPDASGVCVAA